MHGVVVTSPDRSRDDEIFERPGTLPSTHIETEPRAPVCAAHAGLHARRLVGERAVVFDARHRAAAARHPGRLVRVENLAVAGGADLASGFTVQDADLREQEPKPELHRLEI